MSECNPINSTRKDHQSVHHLRQIISLAVVPSHGHNHPRPCSIRRTPTHRLAALLRQYRKEWRLFRRLNRGHLMDTLQTVMGTGHHHKCPSRPVDPHHDRRRISNRETAVKVHIRSRRVSTRHKQCASVSEFDTLILLLGSPAGFLYIGFLLDACCHPLVYTSAPQTLSSHLYLTYSPI